MNVENPVAYSFILQDDIYLLNADKALYSSTAQVTPFVAAEPIIAIEPASPVIEETKPVSFNYLGGNKKNLLIIVHYPQHDHIADPHLMALNSIIGRLTFGMDDVAIVNRANYSDVPFEVLVNYFAPKKLLLLGERALPAGIPQPALNKVSPINSLPALFSFSFDEMMDNTDKKKLFWEQMKQL